MNVRYQPGKLTEDICVFGKMGCSYTPKGNMKYHPQMVKGEPYKSKGKGNRGASSSVRGDLKQIPIDNKGERYPTNILEFDKEAKSFHPTQKPVALYKWILSKYAKQGDIILDTHVGSASSLIACEELGFNYVGFEIDEEYYKKSKARLDTFNAQMRITDFI